MGNKSLKRNGSFKNKHLNFSSNLDNKTTDKDIPNSFDSSSSPITNISDVDTRREHSSAPNAYTNY